MTCVQGEGEPTTRREIREIARCAVLVLVVACGGKDTPPPAPPSNVVAVPDAGPPDAKTTEAETVLVVMGSFRDEMCKCTDKACADVVQERMTKWAVTIAENRDRPPEKMSEEDMRAMTVIGQEYGDCMVKVMSAGSSPTP